MPDYDYGNARLRVMKSRLLSNRELETLMESGGLQGLIAALTRTVYQKPVEEALTRAAGMRCVDEALRNDLISTMVKVRGFYQEDAGKMVAIILRSYDVHNLTAILRGLAKNLPAGDILTVLLPIGELDLSVLRELAQLNNPREAIDVMASMGLPFAQPLLELRAEMPGAETFEMELALKRWYYADARQTLRSETGLADSLSSSLALEIDLANVLTVLRFAHDPREREHLRERIGTDDITHFFLGPGRIPHEMLVYACKQDLVASAVEALAKTFIGPTLRTGLEIYGHSNRLSDVEKKMKHYQLEWMARQISKDPLGIGLVFGYIALKVNEIGNLRWIAQGVNMRLKTDAIRAELETVS